MALELSQYEIDSRLSRLEEELKTLREKDSDDKDKLNTMEKELAVLKSGILLQLEQVKTDLDKTTTGISRTLWIGGTALITAFAGWILKGGLSL